MGKTPPLPNQQLPFRKHPHERGEDANAIPAMILSPGNTPTSVGKTGVGHGPQPELQKHPHERGEDLTHYEYGRYYLRNTPTSVGKTLSPSLSNCIVPETPPRAWGRLETVTSRTQNCETPPRAWGRHWILLVLTGGWWRFVLWLYLFFNHKGHA